MMNQKLLVKVLATMLAVILTFANFAILGVYASKTYATDNTLENQKIVTNNENVEFDAYFINGKEKVHTVQADFNEQNIKMNLSINVKSGYLKDAKIQMSGENGTTANFKIVNNNETLETVETIDEKNNIIALKQLNGGTQAVLQIPLTSIKDDIFDLSNLNKINNIKLTGTYVDNQGKTIEIEKTIQTRNEWTATPVASIEQETKAYVPYQVGEETGTMLQTIVRSGLENNVLPIKQTKLSIKVPEINGVKPKEAIVTANTYATNNQSEEKFSKNNWNYDAETGIINITVDNTANENKVTWNKNAKDEYIITYIYEEKMQNITTTQNAEVTINAYNNVATEVKKANELKIEEAEAKGKLTQTTITAQDELSKGYLYTKSEKETNYEETINTEVAYAKLTDKISIENAIDNFVNSDETTSPTTVSNINYAYYKTTTISKDNFEKILGNEGYIKIIGANGQELATINSQTTPDAKENYVYTYTEETNQIKIETSKPVAEGTLKIRHQKSLKGKTDYSKEQIATFEKLQLKTTTNLQYKDTTIATNEATKDITLIAPSTKIEAQVSKSELSTVVKNENVEFRVILKTNDLSCDLYKNPTVEIVLPSYIDELKIKDINLLYDKELSIADYKTYKNDAGNTIIKVTLTGEDTIYNQDEISKGANIVINTDITLKQLTPTTNDVMKVYVTNELATTYETNAPQARMLKARSVQAVNVATSAYTESTLNAVAPVGMVTYTSITGYNAEESVTSVNGDSTGKLAVQAEAKTATVNINIINNYSNTVKNATILGRIPFEGNKDILTGEDLGSNLTTTLTSFNANGLTVYYSENAQATQDLTNTANGWSQNLTSNAKSYLVVLGDMETGATKALSYNITIPANLVHNKQAYATHVVYFTNGTTADKQKTNKVGFSTGEGVDLEARITSDKNDEIEEGKNITYTVEIKNTGKTTAKNLVVQAIALQQGRSVVEDDEDNEQKIEELASGQTTSVSFKVTARSKIEENETIKLKVTVTADDLEKAIDIESAETKVSTGYFEFIFDTGSFEIDSVRREGQTVDYVLQINNVNSIEKENVIVKDILPVGVTYVKANYGATYNETTREVEWNLGTIEAEDSRRLILTVTVDKLQNGETTKNISNQMIVTTADKELKTDLLTIKISKPDLEIKQTISKAIFNVGDIITYKVTLKNIGAGAARDIKIRSDIPEGLKYIETHYTVGGKDYITKIGKDVSINIPVLSADQTVELNIKVQAEELDENMTKREVTSKVMVSANSIEEKTSNEIKFTILPTEQTDIKDPTTDKIEEGTYTISGTAWLDSNEDGILENDESTLGNIEVILINAENGQIVKDIVTDKNKQQTTDENGRYIFANLETGKYIVVYLYDSVNYGLTTYKISGVDEEINSDAIANKVQLNGQTQEAAVTDAITITDSNASGINVGLVVNKKFDLKLDKVVSKITVTDSKGKIKVNDCKDAKFAKIDLDSKTIDGANVAIEYKIKVTNEGGVAGYVKKIVDYLPKEMKFTSNLNQDWYQGQDGNIYNASLANTIIAPGETKELTLVLTKKMTSDNTGNVNNTAEIYEAYNNFGIQDKDSTLANQVQSEDDLSSADAMLGVKTGEVYVYIVITLISVTILGIGIYIINRKVLRRI